MSGPAPKPLLVALGDSITVGREDRGAQGWHGWVPRLAARLGIPAARVLNVAEEGAHVEDVVTGQVARLAGVAPDVIGFCCGLNDILDGTAPDKTARYLSELLEWTAGTGAVVVTTAVQPCWERIPLSRVRRERLQREVADYNELLRKLSARHGASCLDPLTLSAANDPDSWAADGMHLSAAGHDAVAGALALLARARLPMEVSARISLGLGWS